MDNVMRHVNKHCDDAFHDGALDDAGAELARLRRMADAYAEDAVRVLDDIFVEDPQEWFCIRCRKKEYRGTPIEHAATCDVAAHLGLPREKGDGET